MKTTLFFLISMILFMNSCRSNTYYSEKKIRKIHELQTKSIASIGANDTILNNIEQKVAQTFARSLVTKEDNAFVSLEQKLLKLTKENFNSIVVYWYSYICYYQSIYYVIQQNNKEAENIINKGIELLKKVQKPTSEHLALLALMESFSIQFLPRIEIAFVSPHSKVNAEKALALDTLNLRAYYVLASIDFYTPANYGGGKKAEGYLKKAIKLKDQQAKNKYLPAWGKSLSYEMLIRFYLNNKQYDNAKLYYKEAITLYPDEYMINRLAAEILKH